MYAHCPDCETELDQSSGICPACRWDPILSIQQPELPELPTSLTERYRGSELDSGWSSTTVRGSTVSRGRALVILGLLGLVAMYWVVLVTIGNL